MGDRSPSMLHSGSFNLSFPGPAGGGTCETACQASNKFTPFPILPQSFAVLAHSDHCSPIPHDPTDLCFLSFALLPSAFCRLTCASPPGRLTDVGVGIYHRHRQMHRQAQAQTQAQTQAPAQAQAQLMGMQTGTTLTSSSVMQRVTEGACPGAQGNGAEVHRRW